MDATIGDKGPVTFGPFVLDPIRRRVSRDGAPIVMPARQFDLLLYLVRNPGRVVEKDELLSAIWGGRIVEEGNLTQAISRLRRALDDGSGESYIVTASGIGYSFAADVRPQQDVYESVGPADAILRPAAPGPARFPRLVALGFGGLLLAMIAVVILLRHSSFITAQAPKGAAFAPPPHSVAVMAFTNLSGDPGQEYFSDGVSEELIDALGRIGTLRVPARLSSFSFKGKQVPVREIARQLDVAAVLEGSVRRSGSRLRVTAQLIDAITGYQIWSNSFDQDTGDVLKIQAEIARAVATALQVTIVGDDATKMALGGTTNPRAFDAYLRGMKLHNEQTPASIRGALAAFNQALTLDPQYALAHVRRVSTWILIEEDRGGHEPGDPDEKTILSNAVLEARQAVALAPELGPAHTILGNALEVTGDFAAAGVEQSRGLQLAPQDAWVTTMYALYQAFMGHREAAVAAAQHGVELDPLSVEALLHLSQVLIGARKPVEALSTLGRAAEMGLTGPYLSTLRQVALLEAGSTELARARCEAEPTGFSDECLAIAYHALGRKDDAEKEFVKIQTGLGEDGAIVYACIYSQWNQPDDALSWLEKDVIRHDPALIELNTRFELDPIRDTPRFKEIYQKLSFPA